MSDTRLQSCPSCGSEHLAWHVHRHGGRALRHSERELKWSCRDCTHLWSEPLGSDPSPPQPMLPPT